MKTAVLKPGSLVSLKTSIKGAVNYQRREIEPDHPDQEGGRVARWETYRHIPDAKEFEAATQVRSRARSLISSACVSSSFGLLCPTANEGALTEYMAEAQRLVGAFNEQAVTARVEVYVLLGRIAHDEAEAVRAIGSEMRDLLDTMEAGIKAADPETIREAANKARELGAMLSEDVSKKVSEAITQARTAARAIVARVQKAGETAATVVAELSIRRIEEARFSFLDFDEAATQAAEQPARALDLGPDPAIAQLALGYEGAAARNGTTYERGL